MHVNDEVAKGTGGMSEDDKDQASNDENDQADSEKDQASNDEKDEADSEKEASSEKFELSEEGKEKVKEMRATYDDDRQTAVLPGTDGTITGVAINEWLDDDGNPKYGQDEQQDKDSTDSTDSTEDSTDEHQEKEKQEQNAD
jgi:hypothetical protein